MIIIKNPCGGIENNESILGVLIREKRGYKMITVKTFSRQIILNVYENDRIVDFYGRTKFCIKGSNLTDFYGRTLYRVDGDYVKDFYGKMLYKLSGNEFKDFYGKTLLKFESDSIKDFYGKYLYLFTGNLDNLHKMILGTLYMEYGSIENAIK